MSRVAWANMIDAIVLGAFGGDPYDAWPKDYEANQ